MNHGLIKLNKNVIMIMYIIIEHLVPILAHSKKNKLLS